MDDVADKSGARSPVSKPQGGRRWISWLSYVIAIFPCLCCGGFLYISSIRVHLTEVAHSDLREHGVFWVYVPEEATNISIQGSPYRGSGSARFRMDEDGFKHWAIERLHAKPIVIPAAGWEADDAYVGGEAVRDLLVIKHGWYHEEYAPRGSGSWCAYDADTGWCYSGWSTH